MLLKDGDEIGKRYAISKRIGGGGFGDVYHAWDRLLKIDVALKIPRDQDVNLKICREGWFKKWSGEYTRYIPLLIS